MDCTAEFAIENWLGDADIAMFRHPLRQSIYAEIQECIRLGKAPAEALNKQGSAYWQTGFPDNSLYMCGIILRRHNENTATLNQIWWHEVVRYSYRDQISFPYALWVAQKHTNNLKFREIPLTKEVLAYFHKVISI
jgi:hypothetical protein